MTYMMTPARMLVGRAPVGDVWSEFGELISSDGAIPAADAPPEDAVSELASGTSTTASDFVTVGDVCKPRNLPALNYARDFQNQLNRVAQVKHWSKIVPDGAIGPATLALFRQVQAAAAGAILGDPSSCMGVAPDVDVLGAQVKQYADTLNAPAMVSPPVTAAFKAPTILTKSGKTVLAPDAGGIAGSLAQLSGAEKIALLGLAGGIVYMVAKKRKRRK